MPCRKAISPGSVRFGDGDNTYIFGVSQGILAVCEGATISSTEYRDFDR
ncbi:MAG: hypothetical protein NVSMB52_00320 [Chloroflexota bacterium]